MSISALFEDSCIYCHSMRQREEFEEEEEGVWVRKVKCLSCSGLQPNMATKTLNSSAETKGIHD